MFRTFGQLAGIPMWQAVRPQLSPLVAGLAGGLACHAVLQWRPPGLPGTVLALAAGAVAYGACLALLSGRTLASDAVAIRRMVFVRR